MQNQNQDPNLAAMLEETNRLLAEARFYAGDDDPGVASILDVADKMVSHAQGVAQGTQDPARLEAVQRIMAEQAAQQHQQQEAEPATEDVVTEKGDLAGGAYPASFDPNLASLLGQANQMVTETQAYVQQAPVPSTSAPLVDPSLVAALEDPASAPMNDTISSTLNMTNTALGDAQSVAQGEYTPEQVASVTQRYDNTASLIDGYLQEEAANRAYADYAEQVQESMMDNPSPLN